MFACVVVCGSPVIEATLAADVPGLAAEHAREKARPRLRCHVHLYGYACVRIQPRTSLQRCASL